MGVIATCKTGCDWTSSPMNLQMPNGNVFRMDAPGTFSDELKITMVWSHCTFPCSPCPSPQTMTLWFRKWNGSGWDAWKKVRGSVILCTPQVGKVVRCQDTVSFAMTAGVGYERFLWWCERGVFQILADTDCTTGDFKSCRARRVRVIVV